MLNQEMVDRVLSYVRDYNGNSNFFRSVQRQLNEKGVLSERQITKINEILDQNAQRVVAPPTAAPLAVSDSTYAKGQILELKNFIARKLQESFNLQYTFRNVEIMETLRETDKAIQVKLKLSPRYSTRCCVCGLPLDTNISRATGIGPVCAEKWGIERYKSREAGEIIKDLEDRLSKIQTDEPFWIPRSQIRSILGGNNE